MSLQPALDAYAARLRARFGGRLRAIVLFGSWARGEADEDSDVDILVQVDGLSPREALDAAGDVAAVILATNVPLAPVLMSTERVQVLRAAERGFVAAVDAEGIVL
jgi:uncharacterized protein